MNINISKQNSKIGKIPNLSLTPGASCVPNVPCLTEGCYALSSHKRFPNVRNAWDGNLRMYHAERMKFFLQLHVYLDNYLPTRFRLFVGGDFPDWDFYNDFNTVVKMNPNTEFLAFTKRHGFNFKEKADNFTIILSTWPGMELPVNEELPWSWLEEDPRKPEAYFRCPGGCDDCGHECWGTDSPIVFPKH